MNFPPGLLQAALDGQRDAFIDIAHILIDLGDPRGLDILWRLGDEYANGRLTDFLKYHACPCCGDVKKGEGNVVMCRVETIAMQPDGTVCYDGNKCRWVREKTPLLKPLVEEEE